MGQLVTVSTIEYPAWWNGATTVKVTQQNTSLNYTVSRSTVEFLPQGVSFPVPNQDETLIPWWNIDNIQKAS